MRRYLADMNPFVRGLLVVALIALVVVVLQLQATLVSLFLLARIAFFLAVAFFLFLLWRERRSDIAAWPTRAKAVFYAAILLAVVAAGLFFWAGVSGLNALAFVLILAICAFSVFRIWRDQHTYGY